jgi:hypothetical protein
MFLTRSLAIALIAALLNMGLLQTAGATALDTAAVLQLEDRAAAEARIQAGLARDDVRRAMQSLGVDPVQARDRVAALTDAEVAQLDGKLAQLPAGGEAGWVLLFIVMAVLIWMFATGKLKYN